MVYLGCLKSMVCLVSLAVIGSKLIIALVEDLVVSIKATNHSRSGVLGHGPEGCCSLDREPRQILNHTRGLGDTGILTHSNRRHMNSSAVCVAGRLLCVVRQDSRIPHGISSSPGRPACRIASL